MPYEKFIPHDAGGTYGLDHAAKWKQSSRAYQCGAGFVYVGLDRWMLEQRGQLNALDLRLRGNDK